MIKVSVIGTGGYAYEQIKRLWALSDLYEIVAAAPSIESPTPGEAFCARRDIPIYRDLDDLLFEVGSECDVIIIPTPIHAHYPLAKQCLELNKNVFLEKPPVATIQELDELITLSNLKGISIPVCFQHLYGDAVATAKKAICEGQLGKIRRIRAISCWSRTSAYYNRADWAGKLTYDGCWVLDGTINNPIAHALANTLYLASDVPAKMASPRTVQAELYRGNDIETEDTSSLRIHTTDGIEILFNSTLCAGPRVLLDLVVEGEKGSIHMRDLWHAAIRVDGEQPKHIRDSKESRDLMLSNFADCYIRKTPYLTNLAFCRPFTLAVNCAFESAQRIIPVPEQYLDRHSSDGEICIKIRDINFLLQEGHDQGKLLSELKVPWAVESRVFEVGPEYKSFPVQFSLPDREVFPLTPIGPKQKQNRALSNH